MLPSLSTIEAWKAAGELFKPWVMEKVDEVVAVEVRLPGETPEAMVNAESRRIGMGPSDALAPDNCLVKKAPLVVVGEVVAVVGEADDEDELGVPIVEFFRGFARHSCNRPVYFCLCPRELQDET